LLKCFQHGLSVGVKKIMAQGAICIDPKIVPPSCQWH
jgi:hypothetical protein